MATTHDKTISLDQLGKQIVSTLEQPGLDGATLDSIFWKLAKEGIECNPDIELKPTLERLVRQKKLCCQKDPKVHDIIYSLPHDTEREVTT